ncbi:CGH_1_collapsed_G0025620.mRNA.1.CDS.1 [Saccharomyces cerevisiae]|nr:CGH_1_collapsed_G0025620.mRNA.1.CDS.1 [Saccharomyces cerevisiae]
MHLRAACTEKRDLVISTFCIMLMQRLTVVFRPCMVQAPSRRYFVVEVGLLFDLTVGPNIYLETCLVSTRSNYRLYTTYDHLLQHIETLIVKSVQHVLEDLIVWSCLKNLEFSEKNKPQVSVMVVAVLP